MRILRYLGLVLLLFAWLQPLHFLPWMSWHSEALAFFSVLLLSSEVLTWHVRTRIAAFNVPSAVTPLLLLMLVVAAQIGTKSIPYSGDGVVILLYISLCILAIIVGYHTISTLQLASILLIGAVCSVVIELVQVLNVWEFMTWISRAEFLRRPGGNLGQTNHLATLLLMGLASLVFIYELKRASGVFVCILATLLLVGVSITESRTAIVGLLLMGMSLLIFKNIYTSLRTSNASIILALCGFGVFISIWPRAITYILDGGWTEAALTASINTTTGMRFVVWPQLVEAMLQRPWLGWGFLEVSKAYNAILHLYPTGGPFAYSHNIILDFAIGLGIPIALLFGIGTIVWIVRRIRAVRSLQSWYCMVVILPFGVHAMLEFPHAYSYFLLPVMLAVGALERELANKTVFSIPRWFAIALWSIVTLAMGWSAWEYLQAEEDFRIVRFEARSIGKTPTDYTRPQIILLTQLDAMLEASRLVPEPHMSAERIELARKAAMRFPWTATQNRYALSLALNGNPEEARRQIKVMHAMHGEQTHLDIMQSWKELADTKYPQLTEFIEP